MLYYTAANIIGDQFSFQHFMLKYTLMSASVAALYGNNYYVELQTQTVTFLENFQ